MIDVTVKTLDSQNRRYSVPDDVSTFHVVLYLRVYSKIMSVLKTSSPVKALSKLMHGVSGDIIVGILRFSGFVM